MINLGATEILAIRRPEDFFSHDPDAAKKEFYELAKRFHPDTSKELKAEEVFKHVNFMYAEVCKKFGGKFWDGKGVLQFETNTGTVIKANYLSRGTFELGTYYVGHKYVLYVLESKHQWFFQNGKLRSRFLFINDKMREEFVKCLPHGRVHEVLLADGRFGLRVEKFMDQLLLSDVLKFYGGGINPRHVAWILSGLYNVGCYLSWAKLTHNNISPETYFISPSEHSGALLGGWWYWGEAGSKLRYVPKRTHDYLPWDVRVTKLCSAQTDAELIKATGRQLLGDIEGRNMAPTVPNAMKQWLTSVTTQDIFEEYQAWKDVLVTSFGPRRFEVMDLSAETLYKKES